jgi:hypothetical protein
MSISLSSLIIGLLSVISLFSFSFQLRDLRIIEENGILEEDQD